MRDSQLSKIANVGVFPVAILILTVLNLCALVADTFFALPKEVTSLRRPDHWKYFDDCRRRDVRDLKRPHSFLLFGREGSVIR